jgi:hypothetical protein
MADAGIMVRTRMNNGAGLALLVTLAACGGRPRLSSGAGDAGHPAGDAGVKRRDCTFKGFADAVRYTTSVEGLRLLPVDLNDDGHLALIVGGWWNGQQTFRVFTNHGDGTFTDSPLSLPGDMSFINMVTADFNGDGAVDLASQKNGSDGVDLQTGDGVLSINLVDRGVIAGQPTSYPTPQTSGLLVTGDFDKDGHPDLVFAGNDFVEVYGGLPVPAATNFALNVYRNLGDGQFVAPASYPSTRGYKALVIGDFNGDGYLDVATDAFGVFYNRGDGTFRDEVTFAVPSDSGTAGLVAADFDGDGVDDFATTTASRSDAVGLTYAVQVFTGSRSGDFTLSASSSIPAFPSSWGLAVGDFNGDGRPDLAMEMSRDQQNVPVPPFAIVVLENRGDGTFSPPLTYLAGGIPWDSPTGFAAADFNSDGVTDFVLTTQNQRDPYPTAVNVVLSMCE